ncbi:armadillo-type protein [Mycena crocata]|nr:armadillo-type protein [Mycena crocata]
MIADRNTFRVLVYLLESSHPQVLSSACALIADLALLEVPCQEITQIAPYEELIKLLRHSNESVIKDAVRALDRLTFWTKDGAQAAVVSNVLPEIRMLLHSKDTSVLRHACSILANLARHRSFETMVIESVPYQRLVYLLSKPATGVELQILRLLQFISTSERGCRLITDATYLPPTVHRFLSASASDINIRLCAILRNIASWPSTAAAVADNQHCRKLVHLITLRDHSHKPYYPAVVLAALSALERISWCSSLGARAVVKARALPSILCFLESGNPGMTSWTCRIMGNIAKHELLNSHVTELDICEQLVSLLEHSTIEIQRWVLYLLCSIAKWSEPQARAAIDADLLPVVSKLVQSTQAAVSLESCKLLSHLAKYRDLNNVIVEFNPCEQIVPLLRRPEIDVQKGAILALLEISRWSEDGCSAIVDADGLPAILDLWNREDMWTMESARRIVGNIERFPSLNTSIESELRQH